MANNQDVIIDEYEFKKACNKMLNYISFLERQKKDFNTVLNKVQNKGIKDRNIVREINRIQNEIIAPSIMVEEAVNIDVKLVLAQYVSEIQNADNFNYPSSFLSEIRALLSQFV